MKIRGKDCVVIYTDVDLWVFKKLYTCYVIFMI